MKEEIIEGFVRDQYGYCHYFVENEKAFIYNLYTYPEYRKKGHARNHIEYVIKEIRKSGYGGSIGIEAEPRENSISLESLSSFYTAMGLEVVEVEKPAEHSMLCLSCGCVVDKKGIGHHSAADCVFMHSADLYFAVLYHAEKCAECKKDGWIRVTDSLPEDEAEMLLVSSKDDRGIAYISWSDDGN